MMRSAIRAFTFAVALAMAVPFTRGQAQAAPEAPLAHHAVIISIDGCRPDVLLRANTPVLHGLLEQGAFTFYAETTDIAITLPSHTSMITGVPPEVHGINFNKDPEDDQMVYPRVMTVLEIAHAHQLTTGLFSTKSKFRIFARPNVIDYSSISKESSSPDDVGIAQKAAAAIIAHKPGAMLVHFGNNDKVGHAKGWGSPEQFEAMAGADKSVGIVIDALKAAGIFEDTLVIISADHGGSGKSHGKDDPRSRYIPWIAVGPGIRKNLDLTSYRELTVHTEDTFATACRFLGLPMPEGTQGKPIRQMMAANTPPAAAKASSSQPAMAQ